MRLRLAAAILISLLAVDAEAAAFVVDGEIGDDTVTALEATSPDVTRVQFDSTGGDFFAALRLARLIRDRGLDTDVGFAGKCFSACTVAFQAGRQRSAHPTATFLYHPVQSRTSGATYVNSAWTRLMKESLVADGAAPDLIDQIGDRTLMVEGWKAVGLGVATRLDFALSSQPVRNP
jgi:hypothetical protein